MDLGERHNPQAAAAVADDGWIDTPDAPPAADARPAAQEPPDPNAPVEITPENEPPRDPRGRFERPGQRHRARSQQAGPEDVPRIQELTRKLRETERALEEVRTGKTGAPEAPTGTAAAPAAAEAVRPAAPARPSRPIPPKPPAFTLTEPVFDDFANEADPLTAYHRAVSKFDRQKEQHELAVRYHEQESTRAAEEQQTAFEQEITALSESHMTRLNARIAADPTVKALLEQHKDTIVTGPMLEAILRSGPKSDEVMIALLKNQSLLDELALATYNRPATPELVALVQRRLTATGTAQAAAGTGSAAVPLTVKPAPRPPNPVRTAPEAPPRELPGDDASWEEHRAAFHRPQRSRLRRDR